MKLEEIMNVHERGTILIGSEMESAFLPNSLKTLLGSKILVRSIDDSLIECEVIDVNLSFSIAGSPIIGLNIKEKLDRNKIKKGSIIQKVVSD
ncbi:hypothetical protein [Paenibacillus pabuli]|nr:hypothetical protein [Paenibacillus pabuli]